MAYPVASILYLVEWDFQDFEEHSTVDHWQFDLEELTGKLFYDDECSDIDSDSESFFEEHEQCMENLKKDKGVPFLYDKTWILDFSPDFIIQHSDKYNVIRLNSNNWDYQIDELTYQEVISCIQNRTLVAIPVKYINLESYKKYTSWASWGSSYLQIDDEISVNFEQYKSIDDKNYIAFPLSFLNW